MFGKYQRRVDSRKHFFLQEWQMHNQKKIEVWGHCSGVQVNAGFCLCLLAPNPGLGQGKCAAKYSSACLEFTN